VARQGGERDLDVISLDEEPPAPSRRTRRRGHMGRRWWWILAGVVAALAILGGPVRQGLARDAVGDLARRWFTIEELRQEQTRVLGELRNRLLPTDPAEVQTEAASRLESEEQAAEDRLAPAGGSRTWLDAGTRRTKAAITKDLRLAAAGRSTADADVEVTNALADQLRRFKMKNPSVRTPALHSLDADLARLSTFTSLHTGVSLLLAADRKVLLVDVDRSRITEADVDGLGDVTGAVARQTYLAVVNQGQVSALRPDLQAPLVSIGLTAGPLVAGFDPDAVWLSNEQAATEADGAGKTLASTPLPQCFMPVAKAGASLVLELSCVGGQETNPLILWDPTSRRRRHFGDGTLLATSDRYGVWRPDAGSARLEVTDVRTGTSREISYADDRVPMAGSISPDGHSLAVAMGFEEQRGGQTLLFFDLTTGYGTGLANDAGVESYDTLAWSSDGRWVAFSATPRVGGTRLGVVEVEGDRHTASLLRVPLDVTAQAQLLAVVP